MADFDSQLPVRAIATQFTTEVADSAGTTINPAKEDGHLANIDTATASIDTDIDVALSTRASEATLSTANGHLASIDTDIDVALSTRLAEATFTARINTLGQKTMANSTPVVIASDQSVLPITLNEGNTDQVNYDTQASLAASASDTHSFTPAAALRIKKVQASASGQMKVEIKWGTTGGETTKHISFTSKGHLDFQIEFPDGIALTTTDTIQVIRTNTDNQTMDVYSSIVYQLD